MRDLDLEIALIKEQIRKTPYHKGTEHHIGRLKAKLAKLKTLGQQAKKRGGRFGFAPKKTGDAVVVLVGPPSVGKSTLLNKLTNAQSRVAPWSFTTATVIPGMMKFKGAQIQILDLPGIITGAAKGAGRGKEVLAVARTTDLILLMIDIKTKGQVNSVLREFEELKIDLPVLIVVNKIDLLKREWGKLPTDWILISAEKQQGLSELKEAIWQKLELIRVYLKTKGKTPDFDEPLILKKGQTVADVFKKVFSAEATDVSRAFLWGVNARFPGQIVSFRYQLKDEDILNFS